MKHTIVNANQQDSRTNSGDARKPWSQMAAKLNNFNSRHTCISEVKRKEAAALFWETRGHFEKAGQCLLDAVSSIDEVLKPDTEENKKGHNAKRLKLLEDALRMFDFEASKRADPFVLIEKAKCCLLLGDTGRQDELHQEAKRMYDMMKTDPNFNSMVRANMMEKDVLAQLWGNNNFESAVETAEKALNIISSLGNEAGGKPLQDWVSQRLQTLDNAFDGYSASDNAGLLGYDRPYVLLIWGKIRTEPILKEASVLEALAEAKYAEEKWSGAANKYEQAIKKMMDAQAIFPSDRNLAKLRELGKRLELMNQLEKETETAYTALT